MSRKNTQLVTSWVDSSRKTLRTSIREKILESPRDEEVLVELHFVPVHGSFWLATNPKALHPRLNEFMSQGEFVFGNGGVGRVLEVGPNNSEVFQGDYIAIFGHAPCKHEDCIGCWQRFQFTECDYNENIILGHGKGAPDGTLAQLVMLPKFSYQKCFSREENSERQQLLRLMFAFLVADVRNALTRSSRIRECKRMLLVGAGLSGFIAAQMQLIQNPSSQLVVLEERPDRAKALADLFPGSVSVVDGDSKRASDSEWIAEEVKHLFAGKLPDLIVDCSSGNSTSLWCNDRMLSAGTICIPFGFGSKGLNLSQEALQMSGMSIFTTRGVGTQENQSDVVKMINAGMLNAVLDFIICNSEEFNSLHDLLEKVETLQSGENKNYPMCYVRPGGELGDYC